MVSRVSYGHVGVSVFASMTLQELDELGYFHVCLPPDKFSYKTGGVRPSELRAAGPGGGLRSSESVVCCGICWPYMLQYAAGYGKIIRSSILGVCYMNGFTSYSGRFVPVFTKENFDFAEAALPDGDMTNVLAGDDEQSLNDLRVRIRRLEYGFDWNAINTPSRSRHVQCLRESAEELEKKLHVLRRRGRL